VLTYVVRRLLFSIPVLIAASFLTFTFVVLSSDPFAQLEMNRNVSFETINRVKEEKHMNDPFIVRYGYWVKEAVTDQFGTTLLGDRPIWPDIRRVIGNTLQLVLVAEFLAVVIAIAVGVYSAVRQYSFFDYTATSFSFLGLATPVFWLALILQVVVTNIYLNTGHRIVYTAGLEGDDVSGFFPTIIDRAQHLALPWLTLMVVSIAGYSRYMRASMLEVINSDYVRTARAKGLIERRVVMKHAFRNALIPLVTLVALNFGVLLGGAIVTETIFAIDGMGRYFINALGAGDPYPIMAWLMITAVMIIIGNLLADILYGYLDPRIRYD
jgi:peptide/nickel transport system permease protein